MLVVLVILCLAVTTPTGMLCWVTLSFTMLEMLKLVVTLVFSFLDMTPCVVVDM